jgi:transposase
MVDTGGMGLLTTYQGTNWREGRRFRAWELFQAGWKQQNIANALGVTKGAVSQWLSRARREGPEALHHRKPPGGPAKLSPEQEQRLPALLERGAEVFGFRGNVWTQPRVAEVIRREFGVRYHPSQVGRILQRCGWSRQKPVRRARQRDEDTIRWWTVVRWPRLKRGLPKKGGASSS